MHTSCAQIEMRHSKKSQCYCGRTGNRLLCSTPRRCGREGHSCAQGLRNSAKIARSQRDLLKPTRETTPVELLCGNHQYLNSTRRIRTPVHALCRLHKLLRL